MERWADRTASARQCRSEWRWGLDTEWNRLTTIEWSVQEGEWRSRLVCQWVTHYFALWLIWNLSPFTGFGFFSWFAQWNLSWADKMARINFEKEAVNAEILSSSGNISAERNKDNVSAQCLLMDETSTSYATFVPQSTDAAWPVGNIWHLLFLLQISSFCSLFVTFQLSGREVHGLGIDADVCLRLFEVGWSIECNIGGKVGASPQKVQVESMGRRRKWFDKNLSKYWE